ncbi:thermonuclease family protein [Singulisphaera sp. PoT]|uniref:thermonuclease family protein n=1 Tax=Singulisphaera sp. PoT TaxID=3411797 RepID=UPI003BF58C76
MNALSTLLISLAIVNQAPKANWEKVAVIRVVASDTVIVDAADNPMLWVSLLGVGTPETDDARKDAHLAGKGDPNQLESWLPPSTDVWMERRGELNGRPLVMLYRQDDLFCLNALLVRSGAAFVREQVAFPEFSKLVSLETEAKRLGLGLWEGLEPPQAIKPQVAVKEAVEPKPVEVAKADDDLNNDKDEVEDVFIPQERVQGMRNPVQVSPNVVLPAQVWENYVYQNAARTRWNMQMGEVQANYLNSDTGYYGPMLNPNSRNGYPGMLNPSFSTGARYYPGPYAGMWNYFTGYPYAYGLPNYGGYGPYGGGAVYGYFVPVNRPGW